MQSWIVYNVSTGHIICYGREIDVIADQVKIDGGDTSCALYAIQQLTQDPDVEVLYQNPGAIDPLSFELLEVDHDTQEVIGMDLEAVKSECKRAANKDIVCRFGDMSTLSQCIERIQSSIPEEATIQSSIESWMDALESAKAEIDSQISSLANTSEAFNYYNQRTWLSEFPQPVEWEDM